MRSGAIREAPDLNGAESLDGHLTARMHFQISKKRPLQAAAANRDVRSRSFKIYVGEPRRLERRGGEPFKPASESRISA